MGICFEVDSLLGSRELDHPRFRRASVRAAWQHDRQEVIQSICQHFGWERVPWREPSDKHGTEGNCCSWLAYNSLRALAIAIATQNATSTVDALIGAHTVADRFPHLTDRNDSQYTALYIPVGFDRPFQIRTTFYWETCTVASSVELVHELRELYPLLELEQRQQDKVVGRPPDMDWPSLLWLHQELLACAENSVAINLPMLLTW